MTTIHLMCPTFCQHHQHETLRLVSFLALSFSALSPSSKECFGSHTVRVFACLSTSSADDSNEFGSEPRSPRQRGVTRAVLSKCKQVRAHVNASPLSGIVTIVFPSDDVLATTISEAHRFLEFYCNNCTGCPTTHGRGHVARERTPFGRIDISHAQASFSKLDTSASTMNRDRSKSASVNSTSGVVRLKLKLDSVRPDVAQAQSTRAPAFMCILTRRRTRATDDYINTTNQPTAGSFIFAPLAALRWPALGTMRTSTLVLDHLAIQQPGVASLWAAAVFTCRDTRWPRVTEIDIAEIALRVDSAFQRVWTSAGCCAQQVEEAAMGHHNTLACLAISAVIVAWILTGLNGTAAGRDETLALSPLGNVGATRRRRASSRSLLLARNTGTPCPAHQSVGLHGSPSADDFAGFMQPPSAARSGSERSPSRSQLSVYSLLPEEPFRSTARMLSLASSTSSASSAVAADSARGGIAGSDTSFQSLSLPSPPRITRAALSRSASQEPATPDTSWAGMSAPHAVTQLPAPVSTPPHVMVRAQKAAPVVTLAATSGLAPAPAGVQVPATLGGATTSQVALTPLVAAVSAVHATASAQATSSTAAGKRASPEASPKPTGWDDTVKQPARKRQRLMLPDGAVAQGLQGGAAGGTAAHASLAKNLATSSFGGLALAASSFGGLAAGGTMRVGEETPRGGVMAVEEGPFEVDGALVTDEDPDMECEVQVPAPQGRVPGAAGPTGAVPRFVAHAASRTPQSHAAARIAVLTAAVAAPLPPRAPPAASLHAHAQDWQVTAARLTVPAGGTGR